MTDVHLQNFVGKLKKHLMPRILAVLAEERSSSPDPHENCPCESQMSASSPADPLLVFFKSDCMYKHHWLRINYTTYDVRRSQDVINPGTPRRDIMVLADNEGEDTHSNHPFWYARVLGIYHVNVIYTGLGMIDYAARRFDFLWVRWFHHLGPIKWEDCKLDSVAFLPMADEEAFGFLDPKDVLRASHVLPAFSRGRLNTDTIPMSICARDSHDWKRYYVNRCVHRSLCLYCTSHILNVRFVDRDMVMRYYWGLAVGHTYTHSESSDTVETQICHETTEVDVCDPEESEIVNSINPKDDHDPEADNMEFSLEDRDYINLDASDESGVDEDMPSDDNGGNDEWYPSDDEM